jgi:DNA-binding NarL/FixJ family response regulator
MARVIALVPDLLFGSNVQGALTAAGHEVQLTGDVDAARAGLPAADVLVVDLATDTIDGAALLAELRDGDGLAGTRTLGFYSHVDVETRERALAAGFDQVVPRSRMNREGAALVSALAAGGAPGSPGA